MRLNRRRDLVQVFFAPLTGLAARQSPDMPLRQTGNRTVEVDWNHTAAFAGLAATLPELGLGLLLPRTGPARRAPTPAPAAAHSGCGRVAVRVSFRVLQDASCSRSAWFIWFRAAPRHRRRLPGRGAPACCGRRRPRAQSRAQLRPLGRRAPAGRRRRARRRTRPAAAHCATPTRPPPAPSASRATSSIPFSTQGGRNGRSRSSRIQLSPLHSNRVVSATFRKPAPGGAQSRGAASGLQVTSRPTR